MKQVKVNDILYVMDTEAYQITADTDASIIYVPEDYFNDYVALNPTLELTRYNYHTIRVTKPEYDIPEPPSDPRLIVTYNVTDASNPTKLYYYYGEDEQWNPQVLGSFSFTSAEIDGTEIDISELDTAEGKYQLSAGEHTVKYTLADPTTTYQRTFMQCNTINDIKIPNSLTNINLLAFAYLSNLENIEIPNSVTSISGSAFSSSGIKNLVIPDSVTSIGGQAFYSCSALTSITLSNNITTIEDDTFAGSGLLSITIPSGVTSIGQSAFYQCGSLTEMTILPTTPPTLGSIALASSTNTYYVPSASVDAYKAASGWSRYADKIQAIPTE